MTYPLLQKYNTKIFPISKFFFHQSQNIFGFYPCVLGSFLKPSMTISEQNWHSTIAPRQQQCCWCHPHCRPSHQGIFQDLCRKCILSLTRQFDYQALHCPCKIVAGCYGLTACRSQLLFHICRTDLLLCANLLYTFQLRHPGLASNSLKPVVQALYHEIETNLTIGDSLQGAVRVQTLMALQSLALPCEQKRNFWHFQPQ